MDSRSVVAWNLRRLRIARGISQDELSLSAGIERAYVGHLERATKNVTVLTLEKLARALDCHITEFLLDVPEGAPPQLPLRAGRRKAG